MIDGIVNNLRAETLNASNIKVTTLEGNKTAMENLKKILGDLDFILTQEVQRKIDRHTCTEIMGDWVELNDRIFEIIGRFGRGYKAREVLYNTDYWHLCYGEDYVLSGEYVETAVKIAEWRKSTSNE